jgi:acetyl-CoA synthetase
MSLMNRFLEKTEFSSYKDFCKNLKIKVPENFNFAYDIIDEYARLEPERLALVWCDDNGAEKTFTFTDLKYWSEKTANYLKELGIKKGDKVLLLLRRRYEFYFFVFALARIGAIYIPSTDQLTENDLIYRNNAASVKMIVGYNLPDIVKHVGKSLKASPTVETLVLIGGQHEGWEDYDTEIIII